MMSYINETDFVIENKELVYPEIITDGLQLYYDAKGKRDTDYHRDTMLDMSGNKNHGKLHNFAYEKHSGYKDGLVFDYIDDKLVRPTLSLKPDDLTFMLNGNIISFSPDGTVKRVQDGEVIESKGFNLVRNGDFVLSNHSTWRTYNEIEYHISNNEVTMIGKGSPIGTGGNWLGLNVISPPRDNSIFYITALAKGQGQAYIGVSYNSTNLYLNDSFRRVSYLGQFLTNNNVSGFAVLGGSTNNEVTFKEVMAINLTETFGAGNEPTIAQMNEIINRFGFIPNAQDLINRIEYKGNDLGDMENIIDGLYKTEVLSGEEVYTDKADDDAVVHVEVDGKSYQHAGSGKNLLPNPEHWILEDQSTLDENGVFTIPLDSSIQVTYRWSGKTESQRYGFEVVEGSGRLVNTAYFDIEGNPVVNNGGLHSSNGNANTVMKPGDLITFTMPALNSSVHTVRVTIMNSPLYNSSLLKIKNIWVSDEGNIEYEPPIPTPDYPIDIHSLNDFDVVSSVGKRNIILNSSEPMNTNTQTTGLESSVTPEGYYKIIASKGNGNWFYPLALFQMRNNGHIEKNFNVGDAFTFSVDIKSPDSTDIPSLYALGGIHSYTPLRGRMGTEFSRFYITSTWTNLSSMNLALGLSSRSGTFIFRRMKLEKGSTPTPWAPAQEEIVESSNHPFIDKVNLLLDEPLRSVEGIKDRLFRDSDGIWKIERNVGETEVLTASSIYNSGTTNTFTTFIFSPPMSSIGYQTSRCSHFINSNGAWDAPTFTHYSDHTSVYNRYFMVENRVLGVNSSDSHAVRLNKVNSWLSNEVSKGAPVMLVYKSREPYTETLDQELQDKLNNLRSFSENNYVYTVDGDTNLLDTVTLLNNHWYPHSGAQQNPVYSSGQTATEDAIPVYPGAKIRLTKVNAGDNYWRIVWVDKNNNVILRITPTDNDLILNVPSDAYGMRVSYPSSSNAVIKFDKSYVSSTLSENLKPTLHAKFLYNNWYKEDRVINNLMIYNRALTNEEMTQNYKTIKRRWGM